MGDRMTNGAGKATGGGAAVQDQGPSRPHVPRPRIGRGARTPPPPDLAAVGREAVVAFLRDSSEQAQAGAAAKPAVAPDQPDAALADDHAARAERAAAISVATLDRMEAMAAKLEGDIAQALRRQAELQAGAGRAAENAIKAAQESWRAARHADKVGRQVNAALRKVGRYTIIIVVMLVIQAILLLLLSSPAL
jgi:hypothetical protein